MYLGNGDGTFQALPFTATAFLGGVGDYNGDGKLDLMACGTGGLEFLPSNGDGTFQQGPVICSNSLPVSANFSGFNGDGKLDLAILGPSAITILLGNGDGTFTPGTSFAVGSDDSALAADDLNADGKLDLAVSDLGSGNLYLLLGNGDGTFPTSSDKCNGISPAGEVVAADFNGDGKTDLAVQTSNNILIMLQQTPMISLSPTSLTFGPQIVGTTNTAQPVTLTNAADATSPLTIASISAGGDFSQTNTCGVAYLSIAVHDKRDLHSDSRGCAPELLDRDRQRTQQSSEATLKAPGWTSPSCLLLRQRHRRSRPSSELLCSNQYTIWFNPAVALTCSGAPPPSTCT